MVIPLLSCCAVSTGLMALQGEDELGRFMRDHLQELRVTTDLIQGGLVTSCNLDLEETTY